MDDLFTASQSQEPTADSGYAMLLKLAQKFLHQKRLESTTLAPSYKGVKSSVAPALLRDLRTTERKSFATLTKTFLRPPGSARILRASVGHTRYAGSVRSQGRPLRSPHLSGEIFFSLVAAVSRRGESACYDALRLWKIYSSIVNRQSSIRMGGPRLRPYRNSLEWLPRP